MKKRSKDAATQRTMTEPPIEQPHAAAPLTLDPADADPADVPEPEEPEGSDAEYQQVLATAREIIHLEELVIIDPRDEDARDRLRQLRRG